MIVGDDTDEKKGGFRPPFFTAPEMCPRLPPINRSVGISARAAAEVVVGARTLGGQRSADGADGAAAAVDGDRDAAALEIGDAPAVDGALHAEAVGAGGVEVTGLAAGFDVGAAAAARAR